RAGGSSRRGLGGPRAADGTFLSRIRGGGTLRPHGGGRRGYTGLLPLSLSCLLCAPGCCLLLECTSLFNQSLLGLRWTQAGLACAPGLSGAHLLSAGLPGFGNRLFICP